MNTDAPLSDALQHQLVRLAEQLGASSHELAKAAEQIARIRQRLEQLERLGEKSRRNPGDAEV